MSTKEANTNIFSQGAREAASAVLTPKFLKYEITDEHNTLKKAEEVLKANHGLIVVTNHFSEQDSPRLIDAIFQNKTMGKKKLILPVAMHMDNPLYHLAGGILGVSLMPIVTQSTIDKGLNEGHPKNYGFGKYIDKATNGLKKGEIVSFFPQGTRRPKLGQPDPNNLALGPLMAKCRNLPESAVLIATLGIKGITDYSQNKLKGEYIINLISCLTFAQILTRAKEIAQRPENLANKTKALRFADQVVFEELAEGAPEGYL